MKNTKSMMEVPSDDKVCSLRLFTILITILLIKKFIPAIRPEAKI